MSFNLMAEAPRVEDWAALRMQLRAVGGRVETFPMPADAPGDTDGVGISVPRMHATGEGWHELERVIRVLLTEFGMTVTDMNTGSRITENNLEKLEKRLLAR